MTGIHPCVPIQIRLTEKLVKFRTDVISTFFSAHCIKSQLILGLSSGQVLIRPSWSLQLRLCYIFHSAVIIKRVEYEVLINYNFGISGIRLSFTYVILRVSLIIHKSSRYNIANNVYYNTKIRADYRFSIYKVAVVSLNWFEKCA